MASGKELWELDFKKQASHVLSELHLEDARTKYLSYYYRTDEFFVLLDSGDRTQVHVVSETDGHHIVTMPSLSKWQDVSVFNPGVL